MEKSRLTGINILNTTQMKWAFDYSYIMAATNDRVPTVYVKNGRVENLNPKDPITVSYKRNAVKQAPFKGQPTGKK